MAQAYRLRHGQKRLGERAKAREDLKEELVRGKLKLVGGKDNVEDGNLTCFNVVEKFFWILKKTTSLFLHKEGDFCR